MPEQFFTIKFEDTGETLPAISVDVDDQTSVAKFCQLVKHAASPGLDYCSVFRFKISTPSNLQLISFEEKVMTVSNACSDMLTVAVPSAVSSVLPFTMPHSTDMQQTILRQIFSSRDLFSDFRNWPVQSLSTVIDLIEAHKSNLGFLNLKQLGLTEDNVFAFQEACAAEIGRMFGMMLATRLMNRPGSKASEFSDAEKSFLKVCNSSITLMRLAEKNAVPIPKFG
jgi:hypothetical protein